MPAASVALTATRWLPSARTGVVHGLSHVCAAPKSIWHAKTEPGSVAAKTKVGVLSLVGPSGPEPIVVSGGVMSDAGAEVTVNVRVAGDGSVLPAASVARTDTECGPSLSAVVVHGVVQSSHAAESRRHSKADASSLELKAKVGVLLLVVSAGPELIVVSGAVGSGAGPEATVSGFIVLSVSPSASVIVEADVLDAFALEREGHRLALAQRPLPASGAVGAVVHPRVRARRVATRRVEASNETAWPMVGADGVNVKAATGCSSAGGASCTVHVRVAGVASVFPAASVALTLNVCEPALTGL